MQTLRSKISVILLGLTSAGCAANPASLLPVPPSDRGASYREVVPVSSPLDPVTRVASSLAPESAAPHANLDDEPVNSTTAPSQQPLRLAAVDTAETVPAALGCPPPGTRVLLIGDSLSAGLARPMAELAARCGTPFYHRGVVGSHATQWVTDGWLMPQLERAEPTHVLLSMGGNNFMRNDPHKVQQAVTNLVARIRARGSELLWISPPTMPFADRAGVRQMWQQAIGGAPGQDWFPAERLTIPRASDRIHPTPTEYVKLSGILWQWMAARTASAHTA